jgi:Tol biopolymer transport system component
MMLERPGEVIGREEIRHRLWSTDTFVDFEHSLNTAVMKLRQALGDTAAKSRYIETIAHNGYRFIASVERPTEPGMPVGPESTPDTAAPQTHPDAIVLYWAIAGTAASIFLLLILAYYFLYPLPAPRAVRVTEITHSGKVDGWGGLVFDGARLFFLERDGDHWNLVQTSTKGGPAQLYPAPFRNTRIMDISPDHSHLLIANFIERAPELPIWVMPSQGGPPRRLGNVISGSASWTPSGEQIVYSSGHDLIMVDSDGSNPRRLLSVSEFPSAPVWSPDGHTMRFTVNTASGGQPEIWEATADGKNLHPLFPNPNQFQLTCYGQWTPDGKYFIFTAKKGGQSDLWALQEKSPSWHRRLSKPVELMASPNEIWYPVLSRDGHTVFALSFRPAEETARINITSGAASPVLPTSEALTPFFSKDGKWVTYVLGSPRTIWRSKADGSDAMQLTYKSLDAFEPHWSPDGKRIAFVSQTVAKPWKAYLVSADGGKPQPILPQFDYTGRADWSPDGNMLVLEARKGPVPSDLDPQANSSLYLLNLLTGDARKLPGSDGFIGPRWSPDGKHIAAANDPNNTVMMYDLDKRQWTKAGSGTYLSAFAWSRNGRYLYYQDVLGKDEPIYRIRMPGLRRETVFDFHELLGGKVFRCAFVNLDPTDSPIVSLSLSDNDIYAIDLYLP